MALWIRGFSGRRGEKSRESLKARGYEPGTVDVFGVCDVSAALVPA